MTDVETAKLLDIAVKGARIMFVATIDFKKNKRKCREFIEQKIESEFEPLLKESFPNTAILEGIPRNNEQFVISYAFTYNTFVLVVFEKGKVIWVAIYPFWESKLGYKRAHILSAEQNKRTIECHLLPYCEGGWYIHSVVYADKKLKLPENSLNNPELVTTANEFVKLNRF